MIPASVKTVRVGAGNEDEQAAGQTDETSGTDVGAVERCRDDDAEEVQGESHPYGEQQPACDPWPRADGEEAREHGGDRHRRDEEELGAFDCPDLIPQ